MALKAAAEAGPTLVAGVSTLSAAIDLGICARALNLPANRLYESRFVDRMKARLRRTGRCSEEDLARCHTIVDIDDQITAPGFGFGTADRYYATQSALRFIPQIQVPALLITAQDDPFIPFKIYADQRISENENIQVIAPRHGGHLGFLSRHAPRWWADERIVRWLDSQLIQRAPR